jgi:outer membrane protein assembly factor BamB
MRHCRRLAVMGVALALLAGCSWTNTRFDPARTANNPASGISSGTATTLRPAWTVPNRYLFPNPALVADGVVLTSYAGHANAYDAATGAPLWDGTLGGAAIVGDTLFGTRSDTSDGSGYALVALDLHTGAELWRQTSTAGGAPYRLSGSVLSADSGTVFVRYSVSAGTYPDGGLDAWNLSARHLRWSEAEAGEPAVAGGVVYTFVQQNSAPPTVNELVAADERSGHVLWSKPVARPCFGESGPVVSGAYLYAAGETRRVSDGSLVRAWPTCPQADLAVDGTTVFTLTGAGQLTAFDGPTGAVKWTATASTPPTISHDLVLVGAGTAVVAYDEATGHPVSFVGLGGVGATTSPIAADNLLLVGTDNPEASLKAWRPQPS